MAPSKFLEKISATGKEKDSGGHASTRAKAFFREPLIFTVYATVTVFMTYPAITMTSRTYAEARDPLGSLWWFWWLRYSFFERIAVSPVNIVGVPAGLDMSPYRTDPLFNLLMRVLSIVSTETIAYNIVLLVSFFLTGVMAYYLVRYLTGSRAAAALSGFILAFCPYMLVHGKEHLSLVSVFWIPAFFLLLVKAYREKSIRTAAGSAAVFIALTLFNYRYGFIVGICAAVFMVTLWLTGQPWRRRHGPAQNWWKYIPVLLSVLIIVSLLFVLFTRSPEGIRRDLNEIIRYSARPWDYVIPHAEGRAFGYLGRDFIESHLHGGFLVESSLFIGYVPLLLALFAMGGGCLDASRKRRAGKANATSDEVEVSEKPDGQVENMDKPIEQGDKKADANRMILSFAVCGLVAFLISMPPSVTLFGVKLYLPSHLLFKLVPQFRTYARFGIITMFCVAVLCGYAVSRIVEMKPVKKRQALAVAILITLVFLEFTIAPPFRSLDTKKTTDYYRWLKKQPGQTVAAIYPMFYTDSFYNYGYFFQQRMHKKPLVNGAGTDTYQDVYRQSIIDIKNPMTPRLLKGLGAKYVLIIPGLYELPFGWYIEYPFPTEFDFEGMPPGLKEVEKFDECTVYEVTASGSDFIPLFSEGFYLPYIDPEGRFWHPALNTASMAIDSVLEKPEQSRLKLMLMTVRNNSVVSVYLNGAKVASLEINQQPQEFVIDDVSLNPGRNTLELVSDGDLHYLTEIPLLRDVQAAILMSDLRVEKINE